MALALKGNQETLRADVEVFVNEQKALRYKDITISAQSTPIMAASSIVVVESQREVAGRITNETRLYMTSAASEPTMPQQTLPPSNTSPSISP